MAAAAWVPVASFPLPWDTGREDGRRLRRWLTLCLLVLIAGGGVIPFLPVPEVEREVLETLPPQLARIALEAPEAAPPPPEPRAQPEQKTPPEPEVAPQSQPKPLPAPRASAADAREKAAVSGLLAFKDAFSDMREAVDASKLQDTAALQRGAGEAAAIDRAVITSAHSARSAGVNVAALSRDTGGVALSGRETTRVQAPEGAIGEGGVREPEPARAVAQARQRSIEEIRRVFDANKGAIFAIYNRALRADATLQGKVVLELVIDPSGQVSDVSVVASELADATLVAKILSRIRMFDFGRRDVAVTTISYPVHFLPT